MAYRDENEALRERVLELERRLAFSEALVERLLGRGGGTATRRPDSLVGEVVHRVDETSLDMQLDEAGLDAAAHVVRTRLGCVTRRTEHGVQGLAQRWLAHRAASFALSSDAGGTTLRLETDLRGLPILVVLGPVLGAMLSMPLIVWQWWELHHFRETVSLSTSMSVVVLSMLFGAITARSAARRLARRENERHQGVWAALLELTRRHALLPRVRVEDVGREETSGVAATEGEERHSDPGRRSRPSTPRADRIRSVLPGLSPEPGVDAED